MQSTIGGVLILTMILSIIIRDFVPIYLVAPLLWLSGIAAWCAAILLFSRTTRVLRIQVGLLIIVGCALLWIAHKKGGDIQWLDVFASNTGLLSMIAAVGFLRLVALPGAIEESRLPVGLKAFIKTLLGVTVFSSIINVSAPILIADRIHQQRPLQRFTSQSITRVFCAMSSWSPFFGAMAAVLSYVETASLGSVMVAGIPFAAMCVIAVYAEARIRYSPDVERFVGYPMQLNSLLIPTVLMTMVITASIWLPQISILVVIGLSALILTTVLLLVRRGLLQTILQLKIHTIKGLPGSVNELVLFLAAGVLAAGMSALIDAGLIASPFQYFDGSTASMVLGLIVFCAMVGIHPIILISSFTPLLLELQPNPTLLAVTYLFAWNLGTSGCYLSGTHLVFQSRYGIPSMKAAMWNWPYVVVMYFIAAGWLHIISQFLPPIN